MKLGRLVTRALSRRCTDGRLVGRVSVTVGRSTSLDTRSCGVLFSSVTLRSAGGVRGLLRRVDSGEGFGRDVRGLVRGREAGRTGSGRRGVRERGRFRRMGRRGLSLRRGLGGLRTGLSRKRGRQGRRRRHVEGVRRRRTRSLLGEGGTRHDF